MSSLGKVFAVNMLQSVLIMEQAEGDGPLLMICCTTKEKETSETCGKENCRLNKIKRKAAPKDESSPHKKFTVRYSSEFYMEEFKKYLRKFQHPKKKKEILDKLRKQGIHEELRSLNINFKYDINKKLVEFIMTEDEKCSKHLEFNWKLIEYAIIKAEREIMDEVYDNENRNRKKQKICFSG